MAIERVDMSTKGAKRKPPPDRYSVEQGSVWYRPMPNAIRVALGGVEQHGTVVEYCVSGRWARVHVLVNGKPVPNMLKTGWRNRMVHTPIVVWWLGDPVPDGVIPYVDRVTPHA